jgi:hypothetical protein
MNSLVWDLQTIALVLCAMYVLFLQCMVSVNRLLGKILYKFIPMLVVLVLVGVAFKLI